MMRFEKWMIDLGLDISAEDAEKARVLGQIVAQCYMRGLESGLELTDNEVLSMGEAKFVGTQLGKLTEWYLEQTTETS